MVDCSVISALFISAVCCAILANIAGVVAWRERRDGLGAWEWLTTAAFWRSSNFKRPYAPARLIAFGFSLVGAVALGILAVVLMQLLRGGATRVCGLSF